MTSQSFQMFAGTTLRPFYMDCHPKSKLPLYLSPQPIPQLMIPASCHLPLLPCKNNFSN